MPQQRKVGRPKGREPSDVITVRMPVSLRDRLDAYIDHRMTGEVEELNRGIVIRAVIEDLLEREGF